MRWRTCVLAADEADDRGRADEATRLREEARTLVSSIAGSLTDGGVRAAFTARREVASLLG